MGTTKSDHGAKICSCDRMCNLDTEFAYWELTYCPTDKHHLYYKINHNACPEKHHNAIAQKPQSIKTDQSKIKTNGI